MFELAPQWHLKAIFKDLQFPFQLKETGVEEDLQRKKQSLEVSKLIFFNRLSLINHSLDKGHGKLWEFIRDLLLNPLTNPSLIRWERREDGIFKFIQSDKVAKMWGERKQNPRMTYEKLSRAMR